MGEGAFSPGAASACRSVHKGTGFRVCIGALQLLLVCWHLQQWLSAGRSGLLKGGLHPPCYEKRMCGQDCSYDVADWL